MLTMDSETRARITQNEWIISTGYPHGYGTIGKQGDRYQAIYAGRHNDCLTCDTLQSARYWLRRSAKADSSNGGR